MAARVAEAIRARVDHVIATKATTQRIQRRLKEERSFLEDRVCSPVHEHLLT